MMEYKMKLLSNKTANLKMLDYNLRLKPTRIFDISYYFQSAE